MSDWGIKVSVPGRDIGEANVTGGGYTWPPPDSLMFSSGWFAYKVLATGTITSSMPQTNSPVTGRIDTVSVAHGLSYTPLVMMYYSVDGGTKWWPSGAETEGSTTGTPIRSLSALSDSTNVTGELGYGNLAAFTLQVRYVIFAEVGA